MISDQHIEAVSGYYQTPDGLFPRVTSITGVINKPALVPWAAKEERESIYSSLRGLLAEGKVTRESLMAELEKRLGQEKEHRKKLRFASDTGSQVHHLIHWCLRGEEGPRPDAGIEANHAYGCWQEWKARACLETAMVECTVWDKAEAYAGTLDCLGNLLIGDGDGGVDAVIDWKTGSGIYPESFLQIAAYSRCLPPTNRGALYGVIVRLPKVLTDSTVEVKVLDPTEMGEAYEAFLAAKRLWGFLESQKPAPKRKVKAA